MRFGGRPRVCAFTLSHQSRTLALTIATTLTASLVASCQSSTDPLRQQTLIGEYGGDHALLHATATGAVIEYGCGDVTVMRPLVTDAAGTFTVDGLRRRIGGVYLAVTPAPTPVRVDGLAVSASGGTVRLIVHNPSDAAYPDGLADTLLVVRDQASVVYRCP